MRNVRLKVLVCFHVSFLALWAMLASCDDPAQPKVDPTTEGMRWNLSGSPGNVLPLDATTEQKVEAPTPSSRNTAADDGYAVVSESSALLTKAYRQAASTQPVSVANPEALADRPMSRSVLFLRIIGCSAVLTFCGLTLIVFLTSSPMYPDIVAQISSEISLMAGYTCLLLTATDGTVLSEQTQCFAVAVCLQYCFLCVFLFQMLEALYMARQLASCLPEGMPFSCTTVLAAGWGIPALITGVFAATFSAKYTRRGQVCWMDLSEVVSYATIVPAGTFISLHALCLVPVFLSEGPRPSLTSLDFRRARTQLSSRWASLALLVSTTVSWATGVVAEHHKSRGLYVTFSLSSVMLGVFLITFRISTEDQVRKNLVTKVGFSSSVADVSTVQQWPRRSIDSDFSLSGTVSTVTSSYGSQQSLKVFKK